MRTRLVIDGSQAATADSFPVTNPATEEVVHHIPVASAALAGGRCDAGRKAVTGLFVATLTPAQNDGGVQALMTSQGSAPTQRKRWGRRLSK